jgi:hypothetical protein
VTETPEDGSTGDRTTLHRPTAQVADAAPATAAEQTRPPALSTEPAAAPEPEPEPETSPAVEPAEPEPTQPTPTDPERSAPEPTEPEVADPVTDTPPTAQLAQPETAEGLPATADAAPSANGTTPTRAGAPVPTPAAVASVVQEHPPPAAPVETVTAAGTDHAQWGRVDDDGTVWVRTSTGERSVGSYPGATADEALAYFVRKFEEIEGQITLLEQRIRAGGVSPKDADTSITNLRDGITAAHAVGDLDALTARVDGLVVQVREQRKQADASRAAARRAAVVVKERIVSEAESLSTSTDWKRTGDRLRALLDEWKSAARLDRKTDDALWKRFSHARTAFDKHRRAHFAELDTQRASAAEDKEKLIREAEELSSSTDWGPTARRYRDLMTQWKARGRARRDVEDELWARFRAAQDTFFTARNEVFSARDADLAVNLQKKQALLEEAERLVPVSDVRAARNALRSIHDRWEAAGHVPRDDKDAVEGRLRKVDDAVRGAEEAEWKRSNPEARARAEATVNQLRSSIASLDKEAAAATEAGQLDKATKAQEAAAARREWLAEAQRTLAEFS